MEIYNKRVPVYRIGSYYCAIRKGVQRDGRMLSDLDILSTLVDDLRRRVGKRIEIAGCDWFDINCLDAIVVWANPRGVRNADQGGAP